MFKINFFLKTIFRFTKNIARIGQSGPTVLHPVSPLLTSFIKGRVHKHPGAAHRLKEQVIPAGLLRPEHWGGSSC